MLPSSFFIPDLGPAVVELQKDLGELSTAQVHNQAQGTLSKCKQTNSYFFCLKVIGEISIALDTKPSSKTLQI